MRTSCIAEPTNQFFYTVKNFYLDMCQGDKCAAALLGVYKFRFEGLTANGQGPWQSMSIKQARVWLLESFSLNKIREANARLERLGFICTRTSVQKDGNNTPTEVLFLPHVVQEGVNEWVAKRTTNPASNLKQPTSILNNPPSSKLKYPYFKNEDKEIDKEITVENTVKETSQLSCESSLVDEAKAEEIETVETETKQIETEALETANEADFREAAKSYSEAHRAHDAVTYLSELEAITGNKHKAFINKKAQAANDPKGWTRQMHLTQKILAFTYEFVGKADEWAHLVEAKDWAQLKFEALQLALDVLKCKAATWSKTFIKEQLQPETIVRDCHREQYIYQALNWRAAGRKERTQEQPASARLTPAQIRAQEAEALKQAAIKAAYEGFDDNIF